MITTLTGQHQGLAGGPVASQEAIKLLGTNGGGFFNANAAHPFENPTPLTNFLQILAILLHPRRALPDVRQDGARPEAGLGHPRRHDGDVPARRAARHAARGRGQRPRSPRPTSPRPSTRTTPAATWRARRCASASPAPPFRHGATSTVPGAVDSCTTPSPRSAAACPAQHDAGRGGVRRRGLGPLRHARSSPSSRCSSPA